ncbi:MAG TPA: MauE/DoxX family redox-associated membrane protein, partial [Ktedonosporobacter sp.]|nr:MauE/DoxX family redox-associated membrane protein [Ktedonosporobacter sp.]
MNFAAMPLVVHVFLRLFLGSLMLCSGITKVYHPQRAAQAVREYQILPAALQVRSSAITTIAGGLWVSEILAGVGLISGILLLPASLLTLCQLIVFSGAMGINLARGRRDLSCHCGGALGDHRISWWLVGRNALLLAATVLLISLPADPFALDHWPLPAMTAWLTVVLPLLLIVGVVL